MVPTFAGRNNLFRVLAPAKGAGLLRVVDLQACRDGSMQGRHGIEFASLQAAAGQLGENPLHGVHPRAGGGREMKRPVGMGRQPVLYASGLVGAVVVQDDMHRLGGGHIRSQAVQAVQAVQKLLLPMPRAHLARHLARLHIQSRQEGGGAVADVVVGLGGWLSRPQGQPGLGAGQGLDLGLFVDGQHQRMVGGSHVEADHVPGLARKMGIGRHLELAATMGRQTMAAPDLMHRAGAQVYLPGHGPHRPVRGPRRRGTLRLGQHCLYLGLRRGGLAGRPRLVMEQTLHPFLHVPLLPPPHSGLGCARLGLDGTRAQPRVGGQDDLAAPNVLLRSLRCRHQRLQLVALLRRHSKGNASAHNEGLDVRVQWCPHSMPQPWPLRPMSGIFSGKLSTRPNLYTCKRTGWLQFRGRRWWLTPRGVAGHVSS